MRTVNVPLKVAIIETFRTQRAFAEALGVTEETVSRAVSGRKKLSIAQQRLWARFLGTTPESIFRPSDTRPVPLPRRDENQDQQAAG